MKKAKNIIGLLIFLIVFVLVSRFVKDDVSYNSNYEGFEKAYISRVIDGDTIVTDKGERIRIIGINTPELKKEIYSQEAYDFAVDNLENRFVYLESDLGDTDRYGRKLRYVWLDSDKKKIGIENNYSYMIVKEGLARCYTFKPNIKYVEYFKEAQRDAIKSKRGMWVEDIDKLTRGNKIEVDK